MDIVIKTKLNFINVMLNLFIVWNMCRNISWYMYMSLYITMLGFYCCYDVFEGMLQLMSCSNIYFGPIRIDFSGKVLIKLKFITCNWEDIHYILQI